MRIKSRLPECLFRRKKKLPPLPDVYEVELSVVDCFGRKMFYTYTHKYQKDFGGLTLTTGLTEYKEGGASATVKISVPEKFRH